MRLLRSGSSLEVSCPLQRSLAVLALSGAAGLRTIPLRRFHLHRPARVAQTNLVRCEPAGEMRLLFALAVFRSSGFLARELA
jgi:hypothetical protein